MKCYPEYKESSIEWIEDIPAHWEPKRLGHVSTIFKGGTPKRNVDKYFQGDLPWARPVDITALQGALYIHDTEIHISEEALENSAARRLPPGTVLLTSRATIGETAITTVPMATNQGFANFVCHEQLLNIYLVYYLQAIKDLLISLGSGSTYLEVTKGTLVGVRIPLPPLSEQTQIANFLDRKTEQIDELIRIKERRIELLQEQRTALINQAVTKGLDPNVEMKPSGVEWIGEIPAHWEVKRLKYVTKILPSNVDKHIYPDEVQVRLCNYTDVYYNDYITVDTVLAKGSCKEHEFAKFVLRKGDVVITKDSETPDDIGVPTFVKDDLNDVVCGYHLTLIRPLSCRGEFIFRFIQSDRTRRYFELNSNGITRYGLGKPSIENLLLPIPTDSEQQQIANYLDRKTQQIDELISAEQRKIERLKEYRQSLISEVVTGKIDVRNEV